MPKKKTSNPATGDGAGTTPTNGGQAISFDPTELEFILKEAYNNGFNSGYRLGGMIQQLKGAPLDLG